MTAKILNKLRGWMNHYDPDRDNEESEPEYQDLSELLRFEKWICSKCGKRCYEQSVQIEGRDRMQCPECGTVEPWRDTRHEDG